jgi:hypothetical protein
MGMSEGIPDVTDAVHVGLDEAVYMARAIRCGDRLAVPVPRNLIEGWRLGEGDSVSVHLIRYVPATPAWPPEWLVAGLLERWLQWMPWLPGDIREEIRRRGRLPRELTVMGDGSVRATWERAARS